MKQKYFLAFDLGASSGRAILGIISDGKLCFQEIHRFPNGAVETAEGLFWDFDQLNQELRTGVVKAAAISKDLLSIGIDTWGVDYVLFRKNTREVIRRPYHYRDPRTEKGVQKVFEKISRSDLYRRTGIQHMALNTIFQLVSHYEAFPEDFKDSTLLFMPDALAYLLGGNATVEYTESSTSNLLDPVKRSWDWELIDLLGLPRDVFPEVVPPCTANGVLSEELQQLSGLGPVPLVKVGSHDTASAVAAVPADESAPWAYISCGTWALLGAEIPAPLITEEGEKASFTNEGALEGKIRYLTNIMGSWLFQEIRRNWIAEGRQITFAQMEDMAGNAPGWKFLINPNSENFLQPCNMPEQIRNYCRSTGQGEIPDDGALLRCVYDSLALYFRSKLELLQSLRNEKYACLNIIGGGVRDRRLLQSTANALNIPVLGGPVEATAAGNVLAQAIAAGVLPDQSAGRMLIKNSFDLVYCQPDATEKAAWDEAALRQEKIIAMGN